MSNFLFGPTSNPPNYEESQNNNKRDIHDDFKYSVNVSSCDISVRQCFIRKVYTLLLIQLILTVSIGFVIRYIPSIRNWCLSNLWLFYVSIIGNIGFLIALYFKAKKHPLNLILTAGFTIFEAYSLGVFCCMFKNDILLHAISLTVATFVGLTFFSFQTKYDFTSWQSMVNMAFWTLFGFSIFMVIFGKNSFLNLILSFVGAIIFSIYIIIDTQKVIKKSLLDEEILCAISLYIDIVNLFIFIVRILSSKDND